MTSFPAPPSPSAGSGTVDTPDRDLGRRSGPDFTAPVGPAAPRPAPGGPPVTPRPPVPVGPPPPTPRHADVPSAVRGRRRTRIPSLLLAAALTGGLAGAGAALWAQPDADAVASGGSAGGATAVLRWW